MSLLATRVGMTHRCTIERDFNAGTDDGWGSPKPPGWATHLADVPCRTSGPSAAREAVDEDRTVVVVDQRLLVPVGTDVTERDRVASVTYRGAAVAGPAGIEAVLRRSTHLELVLTGLR